MGISAGCDRTSSEARRRRLKSRLKAAKPPQDPPSQVNPLQAGVRAGGRCGPVGPSGANSFASRLAHDCLLHPLDDRRRAKAATAAHRLQAVAGVAALQLVEQRDHQAGAGRAEGVAEGDGATVDIDARHIGL